MLRQMVDALRQQGDLDVGTASVLLMQFEGIKGGGLGFAHGFCQFTALVKGWWCWELNLGREETTRSLLGKQKFKNQNNLCISMIDPKKVFHKIEFLACHFDPNLSN